MEQDRRHHLVDLRPEPLPGRRVVAQTGRDPQERTDEQVTEIRRGGSIGHTGKVPLEHGSSSWCVEHLTEGDQWREQESLLVMGRMRPEPVEGHPFALRQAQRTSCGLWMRRCYGRTTTRTRSRFSTWAKGSARPDRDDATLTDT